MRRFLAPAVVAASAALMLGLAAPSAMAADRLTVYAYAYGQETAQATATCPV